MKSKGNALPLSCELMLRTGLESEIVSIQVLVFFSKTSKSKTKLGRSPLSNGIRNLPLSQPFAQLYKRYRLNLASGNDFVFFVPWCTVVLLCSHNSYLSCTGTRVQLYADTAKREISSISGNFSQLLSRRQVDTRIAFWCSGITPAWMANRHGFDPLCEMEVFAFIFFIEHVLSLERASSVLHWTCSKLRNLFISAIFSVFSKCEPWIQILDSGFCSHSFSLFLFPIDYWLNVILT